MDDTFTINNCLWSYTLACVLLTSSPSSRLSCHWCCANRRWFNSALKWAWRRAPSSAQWKSLPSTKVLSSFTVKTLFSKPFLKGSICLLYNENIVIGKQWLTRISAPLVCSTELQENVVACNGEWSSLALLSVCFSPTCPDNIYLKTNIVLRLFMLLWYCSLLVTRVLFVSAGCSLAKFVLTFPVMSKRLVCLSAPNFSAKIDQVRDVVNLRVKGKNRSAFPLMTCVQHETCGICKVSVLQWWLSRWLFLKFIAESFFPGLS